MLSVVREIGSLSISLRSLAKNEEELERLANQDEPLKEADPVRGDTHTWDSEVSRLVGLRSGHGDGKKVVNITRGNQVEEKRFSDGCDNAGSLNRKGVVWGKMLSVRVELGG